MKKILSTLVLSLFLVSCATPTVVNVVGPNDGAMTCNQVDTQIAMDIVFLILMLKKMMKKKLLQ